MKSSVDLLFKSNKVLLSTPYLRKNITNTGIKQNIKYKTNNKPKSSYLHMYKHLPIKSFDLELNTKIYQKTSGDR